MNMRTHSSRSVFRMSQLDIYIDPPLGRTRRHCSYKTAHSLLQTVLLDSLSEFTAEIKMSQV